MGTRFLLFAFLPTILFALLLTGCGSTGSSPTNPDNAFYSIGGTVSGLAGSGLVLQNNDGDNLSISGNGSFTFSKTLQAGYAYLVTVQAQPSAPEQSCIVSNAVGAALANVTNIQIKCSAVVSVPVTTAAGQWTWASGASLADQAGVFGAQGMAAPGNVPGARVGAVSWVDGAGNLWLFGGQGPPVGGWCAITHALCAGPANEYLNDLWKFDGSQWAWVSGSSSANQSGVYGSLGVAASGNVPGARYGAVSWTDAAGNLWLFGGTGYDSAGNVGALNDLWKFDGSQWTWMGGGKLGNQPGSYGTQGKPAAGNFPGGRSGAIAFADPSGNVWLFGGQGCDSTIDCGSALNDLWELSAGQWTWVSGESVAFPAQPGVYGTQGEPSPANVPGARYTASGWMDPAGNLWLFGGIGYNTLDFNVGNLNDLWMLSGGQWAWESGSSNQFDLNGSYGAMGTPSLGNVPGSRYSSATWTDSKGNLWLYSGEGFAASSSTSGPYLDDLWEFSGGEWIWMGGVDTGSPVGAYGTQGTPGAANLPGGRIGAVTWTDSKGRLWLFGGQGMDANGTMAELNDLWVYQP